MNIACIQRIESEITSNKDIKNAIRRLYLSDDLQSVTIKDLNLKVSKPSCAIKQNDMRISRVIFNNFRSYPPLNDDSGGYGADFRLNGKPASAILIGQNGSGKSSLFSALETIYSGGCSYANAQNVDEGVFLTYGFGRNDTSSSSKEKTKWNIRFYLSDNEKKEIVKDEDFTPLAVPSFLVSDAESTNLLVNDLSSWILSQMGYDKLDKMIERTLSLINKCEASKELLESESYYDEYKELASAIFMYDESDNQKKEIEEGKNGNLNNIHNHTYFTSLWKDFRMGEIEDESDWGDSKSDSSEEDNNVITRNNLVKLYSKLYEIVNRPNFSIKKKATIYELMENQKTFSQVAELKNLAEVDEKIYLLRKITIKLQVLRKKIISDFIESSKRFIEDIMKEFSYRNETFHFEDSDKSKFNSLEMIISVSDGMNSFYAKPHEYLNTFRFKLYMLSMKLAMSFHWMKEHKVFLPIVIDDVFNATDFDNSIRLEQYIYKVRQLYTKLFNDVDNHKPLQMIILTHDTMVYNSLCNGFVSMHESDVYNNTMTTNDFPFIKGRMYRLDEIELINEGKKKNEVKNIFQ